MQPTLALQMLCSFSSRRFIYTIAVTPKYRGIFYSQLGFVTNANKNVAFSVYDSAHFHSRVGDPDHFLTC